MSTITTSLEVGDFTLQVEIEYMAYPSWPPYAELLGVKVLGGVEGLDATAYRAVERRWELFNDMCLEDAGLRAEDESEIT